MTARMQWMLVLVIVGVMAIGAWGAVHFYGREIFPVEVGSEAPDFTAHPLGGTPGAVKTLADYKGQVVLLNIWATWCAPCRVEMPSIEALHRDFGDKGLKVVAVSIDQAAGDTGITSFAKELGLTFEILHDSTMKISETYQVTGYPETFVIGREGTIRRKWIGEANWNSQGNRSLIAQLLGVPDPRVLTSPVRTLGDSARGTLR
jgi:cytochrome c biogenesis protein CcmG, thiol:disulfide interchange protein DsbE